MEAWQSILRGARILQMSAVGGRYDPLLGSGERSCLSKTGTDHRAREQDGNCSFKHVWFSCGGDCGWGYLSRATKSAARRCV